MVAGLQTRQALAKRSLTRMTQARNALRMEDKIRRLCTELLIKTDDEVRPILVELREALHLHIERLSERFGTYPLLVERRARNDIPPTNEKPEENRAETNFTSGSI